MRSAVFPQNHLLIAGILEAKFNKYSRSGGRSSILATSNMAQGNVYRKVEEPINAYILFLDAVEKLISGAILHFQNRDKDRTLYLLQEMCDYGTHVRDYWVARHSLKIIAQIHILSKDFDTALKALEQL